MSTIVSSSYFISTPTFYGKDKAATQPATSDETAGMSTTSGPALDNSPPAGSENLKKLLGPMTRMMDIPGILTLPQDLSDEQFADMTNGIQKMLDEKYRMATPENGGVSFEYGNYTAVTTPQIDYSAMLNDKNYIRLQEMIRNRQDSQTKQF